MDMVEKVAEAIFESWPHQTVGIVRREWKDVGPNDRDATWYPLARAAIEAMREPTDAMVQAGINEGHKCGNWYPAMIDAALDGEKA